MAQLNQKISIGQKKIEEIIVANNETEQKKLVIKQSGKEDKEINDLLTTEILGKNERVVQIGIQGSPKTEFYFNGNKENKILIGSTGIYELDLTNCGSAITSLHFTNIETSGIEEGFPVILIDYLYETL